MVRHAALLVLLLAATARADDIILNSGRRFHGRIVKEDEATVTLRLPFGVMTFERRDIREILRDSDEENLERELDAHLRAGKFAAARAVATQLARPQAEGERSRFLAGWLVYISEAEIEAWQIESAGRTLARAEELAPDLPELQSVQRRLLAADSSILERLQRAEGVLDPASADHDPARAEALLLPMLGTDVPAGRRIRGTYAAALSIRAVRAFDGDLDRAIALMDEALAIAPDAGGAVIRTYVTAHVLAAQASYAEERPSQAMAHVQLALERDDDSDAARYVRGQLHHAAGDLGPAARDYLFVLDEPLPRGAITRELCDELRERCRGKVDLVISIDDLVPATSSPLPDAPTGLFTETRGDIVAHAPSAQLLTRVLDTVCSHRTQVERLLGFDDPIATFARPLEVFLHPTLDAYMEATSKQDYFSGVTLLASDRAGRLVNQQIHSYAGAEGLFDSVLPHEVAHALMSAHLGYDVDLPRWLSEGVAIQAESKVSAASRMLLIRRKVRALEYIDLRLVMVLRRYPSTEEESSIYYAQSYSLVLYLRERFGDKAFWKFAATSAGDLEAGYQGAFGEKFDADQLEAKWKTWLLR